MAARLNNRHSDMVRKKIQVSQLQLDKTHRVQLSFLFNVSIALTSVYP